MTPPRARARRLAAAFIALTSTLAFAPVGGVGAAPAPPPAQPAPTAAPANCRGAAPLIWITQTTAAGDVTSQNALPACTAPGAPDATITLDPAQRQQPIIGFGAALTGSSAWLLQTQLDARGRREVLRRLFAPPPRGIGLSLMRLPIGSTDLSRGRYSLAPDPAPAGKPPTLDLSPMQDTTLPVLKDIVAINPDLRIIASPWSAPAWMKTNHSLIGGRLEPDQAQHFAEYLVQYLKQMQALDIPIYGITLQNEPNVKTASYPGMLMGADQGAYIIGRFLGPMVAHEHLDVGIFALDDNWLWLRHVTQMLDDRNAARYIKGVAWHCYGGRAAVQDVVHRQYPSMVQVLTECSDGDWWPNNHETIAGFVQEVFITPLRHWDSGVILWGLALDPQGGPHNGGCSVCTPVVTVDGTTKTATFTRDYYALAHFSEFVPQGSYRIASDGIAHGLTNVAFVGPDGHALTIVIANRNTDGRRVQVSTPAQATIVALPAKSVATVVFGGPQKRAEILQAPKPAGGPR